MLHDAFVFDSKRTVFTSTWADWAAFPSSLKNGKLKTEGIDSLLRAGAKLVYKTGADDAADSGSGRQRLDGRRKRRQCDGRQRDKAGSDSLHRRKGGVGSAGRGVKAMRAQAERILSVWRYRGGGRPR